MSNTFSALVFIPLVVLSVGCSPIAYKEINEPDKDGLVKFNMQASAIVIDAVEKDGNTKISVTSVPTESQNRYAIKANDYTFWKTTHLNVEKYPNTDIIKSLAIDTEDNRKEFITNAASIAAGIVALGFVQSDTYPHIINGEELVKQASESAFSIKAPDKLNSKDVTIDFGAIPKDAFSIKEFNFSSNSDVYAFSACRTAKVSFYDGVTDKTVAVNVADPNFVQTIKIPEKGSITMHSGCGVDTKGEKSSVNSSSEVLSHLVGQVKSALEVKK